MMRQPQSVLIEGYASVFESEDLAGDVVRPGAFARSLMRGTGAPMLLHHRGGQVAGHWTAMREDGRGLWVRGLVTGDSAAGRAARSLIAKGMLDGLSIGFIARRWRPRVERGRDLQEIDLREISLVAAPMAPAARFRVIAPVSASPLNVIAA